MVPAIPASMGSTQRPLLPTRPLLPSAPCCPRAHPCFRPYIHFSPNGYTGQHSNLHALRFHQVAAASSDVNRREYRKDARRRCTTIPPGGSLDSKRWDSKPRVVEKKRCVAPLDDDCTTL